MHKKLTELFEELYGCAPDSAVQLCGSASNRTYLRLSAGGSSSIGVEGEDLRENRAFVQLARHFSKKRLPVPKILAVSKDYSVYIQEDLGDTLLSDLVDRARKQGSFESVLPLLKGCMEMLAKFQFEGAEGLDFKELCPQEEFDLRSIMFDLNYFKYCFLKATGLEFEENRLEDDFQTMADVLMRSQSSTFMYRDFQSRNVMIRDNEPWLIDFQGGRMGPFYYDVASFLWQAKAGFPQSLRDELIKHYIEALRKYKPVDENYFHEQLRHFVLFRILQVLGAYGFRGYFEKKPHFMQSVPFAIANLRELLAKPFPEYPYLSKVLHSVIHLSQFADQMKKHTLTVKVMSFAYKKGIPDDTTGNGGGFVFDCRAINNPGKYERYKPFTGLDSQVIKFLEDDGEITTFLENCYNLVDASVKRYVERGFTSLMVAFGCTGGQHRSVYSAQHMAEHISRKFNVKVELLHREQNIEQTFEPGN